MTHMKEHKFVIGMIVLISLLLITFLQLIGVLWLTDSLSTTMIQDITLRVLFGMTLIIILYVLGFDPFDKQSKSFLWIIYIIMPGIIISINNFPWSAFFAGRTLLTESPYLVYLFAIKSLSVGFLEEVIFRGIILTVFIQRMSQTKTGLLHAILASSIIFALVHIFNLFAGASPFTTAIQIGYSFLMGALWSMVYLATKNLLYPIILHASYNFFGLVLYQLGTVTNRFDEITTASTILLAIVVILFYLNLFKQLDYDKMSIT